MKNWEIVDVDDTFTIIKDETDKIKVINNNVMILNNFNENINSIVKRTKNKIILPNEFYISSLFRKNN